MKRFCKAYLTVLSLCSSFGLFAQVAQDAPLSEMDLFGEIPKVRIASRLEQSVNLAPASVTVISRELIDASGAQNWVDLFRLVPGFQSYSVNDNRAGVSYHGFGDEYPNRLEVMVDGRSVFEPIFSTVIWNTLGIQLEDIDHIEIDRGPSAASHGSNAFLGAVNIVTRQPLQDKGTTVRLNVGSRSSRNAWLRLNDSVGPLNYRLSLGSRHNDGFPGVSEGELDDGHELYQLAFRGTMTPTLNDELDFNFGYANDRAGFGDADHPDEYIGTEFYTNYQSIEWRHTLSTGGEISLHGYHNSLRGSSSVDLGLISDVLGVDPALVPLILGVPDQMVVEGFGSMASERFDVEFEHQLSLTEGLRTVWGLGGRSEYTQNDFLQGNDDKITEESVRWFTHSEWRPARDWSLNAGLMAEKTFVGTLLSPRFSVSRQFNQHHTLRMSVSRGKRAPSITEANLDQQIKISGVVFDAIIRSDDDLEEEEVTSFELAWSGYFPSVHLGIDLNVFREQARHAIDDFHEELIMPTPLGDNLIKVKSNTGEWETSGVEFQAVYRPMPRMMARLHYAYLDLESEFVNRLTPEIKLDNFNETQARHSGGLLLNYQWTPRLATGLTVYHQSQVRWRDGNFIDEYTRLDSHVTRKLSFGRYSGQLQLVAQNITDDYSEYNTNNIFRSRYFVSLSVDLP